MYGKAVKTNAYFGSYVDRVQFCLENEPNNFAASEFPHFSLFTVQSVFSTNFQLLF